MGWILATFLILIFIFLIFTIIVLAILLQDNVVHEIEVVNLCTVPLTTLLINDSKNSLSTTINSGQKVIYEVTPGFVGSLTAATDATTTCNFSTCPYTTAELSFANIFGKSDPYMQLNGKRIVSSPSKIDTNIQDQYIVSLAYGYNIPMNIAVNDIVTTGFSNTLTNCPLPLQVTANGQQIACASACSANLTGTPGTTGDFCCATEDCFENWQPSSYYSLFADLCPSCQITQFPKRNETSPLTASGTLSKMTITLCPLS
jgi:hypothetical protein